MQLAPALDQRLALVERADEPLPARHDLDRAVALLEELHRAVDRRRLADQLAGLLEQLDDPRRAWLTCALRAPVARAAALRSWFPTRLAPWHFRQPAVDAEHRPDAAATARATR